MGRRQAAQPIELELPDDGDERPEPAPGRARARAKQQPERTWRSRLRIAATVCGVALGVGSGLAGLFAFDEWLATDRHFLLSGTPALHPALAITGVTHAQPAEIARVFAGDFGRSIYLMPLTARRRALLSLDWVRDARISREWPNRVAVRIIERNPVAFVMMPAGPPGPDGIQPTETALIDADGVILAPPAKARFSLPVLLGLSRRQPLAWRRERIRQVDELIREVQANAGQISEIDASDPEDVVITESVEGRAVRLHLGRQRFDARLKNFMNLYPEIRRRLPGASVFDLRLDDRITALDARPAIAEGGPASGR